MFDILFKKKVSEEKLAEYFVNSILQMVDNGFPDVIDLINNDSNFVSSPNIDIEENDRFLLIVIAGNLKYIPQFFNDYQDIRLIDVITRKFSQALGVTHHDLKEAVRSYQSFFTKVNHPSKNTHYAMSKALFFKYGLNEFQEEYFKNMNTPNPIFLKKLDEVIAHFIWDWSHFINKFRIVE